MSDSDSLFVRYANGATTGNTNDHYFDFRISVGGAPDVPDHPIVMDTGSTGIVVDKATILNSTPSPKQWPAPRYSSSGESYQGQWVVADVTITGDGGQSFILPQLPVFASDTPVSMMGVGLRGPMELNPFLNLPQMKSSSAVPAPWKAAFIVSSQGVTFNFDSAAQASFTQYSTAEGPATATVTLTPPEGSNLARYSATLPLLVDTGLSYMIVTPKLSGPQPEPGYQFDGKFIAGVTITVAFGGNQPSPWSFTTSDDRETGVPTYVRFAVPSTAGIINTGRGFLALYDLLLDATDKTVGLRLAQR
jgi:hypothetical protein